MWLLPKLLLQNSKYLHCKTFIIWKIALLKLWEGLSEVSFFRLAKLTAAVLLAKGVPVYLFSRYVPTPFVVSML